jgi:hypothetical protein
VPTNIEQLPGEPALIFFDLARNRFSGAAQQATACATRIFESQPSRGSCQML